MNKLVEEFKRLKVQEQIACDKKQEIAQEWAEISCPHKIGDVVTIKGYSHYGKQGIVKKIFAKETYWNRDAENPLSWSIKGFVLKKDGSEGSMCFDFDESQEGKNRYGEKE